MKQIGVIGCGRIGGPVIEAIQAGRAGDNSLLAVLAQHVRDVGNITTLDDKHAFFNHTYDLIIDAAAYSGLMEYGEKALEVADVWTVNAVALADVDLYEKLETTGRQSGHRLRVLSGAIAGLDGVSALSIDDEATISSRIDVMPSEEGRKVLFSGSVREAAVQFPDGVNVAVTAGLAGTGLDKTHVDVVQPALDEGRSLKLSGQSRYGQLDVSSSPVVRPDKRIHMVAASIIAALRNEDKIIWTA